MANMKSRILVASGIGALLPRVIATIALTLVWPALAIAQTSIIFSNGDVRCAAVFGTDLATTTSRADPLTRWSAATEAAKFALITTNRGDIGAARRSMAGRTFEVTYADGGRENWIFHPNWVSSFILLDQPTPNSLREGDGVAKTRTRPCVPLPGSSDATIDLPSPSPSMSVTVEGYWEYRAGYTYVGGVGGFANGEWCFVITGIAIIYLNQNAAEW